MDEIVATGFHLIAIVAWLGLFLYSAVLFFPSISTVAASAKAKYIIDYRRKAIIITLVSLLYLPLLDIHS
jgi:hypothetical protein